MHQQQHQHQHHHPYYPTDLDLDLSTTASTAAKLYIPNDVPTTYLMAGFASACAVLVVVGFWAFGGGGGEGSGKVRRGWRERGVGVWFLVCGAIHCFFEGYFVYYHESMPSRMDFLGQLWKEYGLSDSRYIFGDPLLLCMEIMSVFILGPCCFITACLIANNSGYRHSMQALVSTGHLYSNLLYFATSLYDDYVLGKQYYRPEPFYFWVYFVGMNSIWLIVPGILLCSSMRNSANAFAEVKGTRRKVKDLYNTMNDTRASLKSKSAQDSASIAKRDNQAFLEGSALSRYSSLLPSSFIYESQLCMIAELELGIPPQHFYLILSLKQSDLFVISKRCEDPVYKNCTHYDSAKSSTYAENGTAISVPFWSALAHGFTSRDTLGRIAKNQTFVEATSLESGLSNLNVYFDGMLGLGPRYGNSSTGFGNLATNLYAQGLIPENIFSMVLPRARDRPGELAFGITHSDVALRDVVMVSVTNVTGLDRNAGYLTNDWQVSAEYVKLGYVIVLNRTLDGFTAVLDTEFPFIGLPSDVVNMMHKYMGANRLGWSWMFALDCKAREKMSDLVFNLGGHEFRITPYDYTMEYRDKDGSHLCISMLMDIGLQDGKTPLIVLGVSFMMGVRTVFDLERNMVGFIELLHRS